MVYDLRGKRYYQEAKAKFKPLFHHDSRKILMKLFHDIRNSFDAIGDINFPVEAPSQLNIPDVWIVTKLVQAVLNQKAVNIIYTSLRSGSGTRDIVPLSIVDNDRRWYVRAYACKSKSFRDFVLTRITKVTIKDSIVQGEEGKLRIRQWMRMMPLQLVPHPHNVNHPTAIALDYGMEDGVLSLNVRAAMAGYLLRCWHVDCTADAELIGAEYQLWLKNRQTLFGAENLTIAPGYVPELEEL